MPDGIASPSQTDDTGLLCLALIGRYFQIAIDADQLRHDHGKPGCDFDASDVVICARQAGFRARCVNTRWDRLERTPLPAIAICKDGRFVIFARFVRDGQSGAARLLIHDPHQGAPELRSREEIEACWTGRIIFVTHREALAGPAPGFDFSWFIPAVLRYRRLMVEVLAGSAFLQLTALVAPLFFQVVTDKVLVHRGLSSLDVLAVGLAVISLFEVVLGALRSYVFSHTTSRIDVELGAALFGHLLSLPMAYFSSRPVGNTVARVRELENIRAFLTGSALTLVVDSVFTIVFFAVMFLYSASLTIGVLCTLPLYLGLSILVTPQLRGRIETKFRRGAESQAFLVEAVGAAETCKAMAVEPQMRRKWEGLLAGYVGASFRAQSLNVIASQVAFGISKAQTVFILWFGPRIVMDGGMTIGALVAFNMLAGRVASPILRMAQLWSDFQQMRVSVERLGDILNTPSENPGRARTAMPALQGRIVFDKVRFRYRPDGQDVLAELSLEVAAGETVGLVGSSGSGKSTLAKLVQHLHVPQSGRVLIDGTDLALIDAAWLRRQLGVVLQDNVLFNCSVRDNIALTDPSQSMDRVIAAARLAAAHDFVLGLPEGYDTAVGERGAHLSGGQRQRIAIARALINDPRILIFDEATAALDYESEAEIRRNMRAMTRGRTVLVIAHRLSAVRDCDRIVVLEKGGIVEQGSHDALMAANGRYAQLWRCQADERFGAAPVLSEDGDRGLG